MSVKRFDEYTDQMSKAYDDGWHAGYEYAWNEIEDGAAERSIRRLAELDDMDQS